MEISASIVTSREWRSSYPRPTTASTICSYDIARANSTATFPCSSATIPIWSPSPKQFGIDYHVFPITKDTKAEQEANEIELLREYRDRSRGDGAVHADPVGSR